MNIYIDKTIPMVVSAITTYSTFALSSITTGQVGAARTTKALGNLGLFHTGMKGGIVTLFAEAKCVDKATEFLISRLFIKSVSRMLSDGDDKILIMSRIDAFPISDDLKSRLRELVNLHNRELQYAK
jgi:hypothetical protein